MEETSPRRSHARHLHAINDSPTTPPQAEDAVRDEREALLVEAARMEEAVAGMSEAEAAAAVLAHQAALAALDPPAPGAAGVLRLRQPSFAGRRAPSFGMGNTPMAVPPAPPPLFSPEL